MCLIQGDFVLLGFKQQAGLIFLYICMLDYSMEGFLQHTLRGKNEACLVSDLLMSLQSFLSYLSTMEMTSGFNYSSAVYFTV